MLPADGSGARPSAAPRSSPVPAPGAPASHGPSPAAARLSAALDRIASALVRRAEADAAARDRAEQDNREHVAAAQQAGPAEAALDTETVEELRHRVDAAILMVRAALDEA